MCSTSSGNGTPATTNGTRLWRYLAGDDWNAGERTSGRVRLSGAMRLTAKVFVGQRNSNHRELTRIQHSGTQELVHRRTRRTIWANLAFVAGADVRDIRGLDVECRSVPESSPRCSTTARQRFIGGFGEAIGELGAGRAAAHCGSTRHRISTRRSSPLAQRRPQTLTVARSS